MMQEKKSAMETVCVSMSNIVFIGSKMDIEMDVEASELGRIVLLPTYLFVFMTMRQHKRKYASSREI